MTLKHTHNIVIKTYRRLSAAGSELLKGITNFSGMLPELRNEDTDPIVRAPGPFLPASLDEVGRVVCFSACLQRPR